MPETPADLLIVGGGINGVGIARDAAGRGLSAVVCEQGDLASATSSASTKLIHGGLRYLEHYEFRLVRESLLEREVLLASAPHIIWPLSFVLPHEPHLRPAWLIRLGLFLYDHLGGRKRLPGSRGIDLTRDPAGQPLQDKFRRGFVYSDCWVQDSRLVVLNAIDAAERGAAMLPRTRCLSARRVGGLWQAELEDVRTGARRTMAARALVNAAGPWVDAMQRQVLGRNAPRKTRLVKGSHIVVPRLFEGSQAYILQNSDRRIVFAIPYEDDFTLIGTTDVPFEGDPGTVKISDDEVGYLCRVASSYFRRPIAEPDVVWTYSGVRPLYDDSTANVSAVTRDYVLELDQADGAPLLSVFGGKITTYRRLAEHALEKLAPFFPQMGPAWTRGAVLPGGDLSDPGRFLADLQARHPWLPPDLARRYARSYGTRVERLLGPAASLGDLGRDFGGGVYEAELRYLADAEWAMSADDVLLRRSKLVLHVPAATRQAIEAWFAAREARPAAKAM